MKNKLWSWSGFEGCLLFCLFVILVGHLWTTAAANEYVGEFEISLLLGFNLGAAVDLGTFLRYYRSVYLTTALEQEV